MRYLIITVCILVGCSTKPTNSLINNNKKDPIDIDITKKYPERTVYVQDIANIEYIPLETNDKTLISEVFPDVVSEQHIVFHNQNGQVIIFNRQGKMLYSFNRIGGSQEEYSSILDIILDEEKEELYIEDISKAKIFIYSIDGKFKRSLALPRKFFPDCLMNYDKDYLFCYNSYFIDNSKENMNKEDIINRDNPYFFISKQTGEIIPLNYNIPNRMDNQAAQMKPDGTIGVLFAIAIYPLVQNTPDILITEFADDTIYSLKDKKLSPIMIKKPSAHNMTPPMMVGIDLFTDKYIFIKAIEKEFNERPKSTHMVYDKQSDNFYQFNLLNKDKYPITFPLKNNIVLPHNTGINYIEAEQLLQYYKSGKLEGELKQIASKIKEDDNPILMLIKFNQ